MPYFLAFVWLAATYALAWHTDRTDFAQLISLIAIQTACYSYVLYQKIAKNYYFYLFLAIFLRFIWLFATPNLSDDVYRFVWDGRLICAGIHPLAHLPDYFMLPQNTLSSLTPALFSHLNSPHYYTVYPTVLQAIFAVSSYFAHNNIGVNIITLKIFIFIFEIGSIYLISRLLLPKNFRVFIYALNPLVINELVGNVHFEAAMIFFLLLSVYLQTKNKLNIAAFAFACAISCKLLPLFFLPVYIGVYGWRRGIGFVCRVVLFTVFLLLPFLVTGTGGFGSSIRLYFQHFEFNASIYYLLRAAAQFLLGYNLIAIIAPMLTCACLFVLIYRYLIKKTDESNVFNGFLFTQSLFFATASIVHPWYITSLVAWSCFSERRYAVLWSLLVPLTYFAYSQTPFQENLYWVTLEYSLVFIYYCYENFYYKSI